MKHLTMINRQQVKEVPVDRPVVKGIKQCNLSADLKLRSISDLWQLLSF